MKKLLVPICWISELYYRFRYNKSYQGHSFKKQDDGSLKCKYCGEKRK